MPTAPTVPTVRPFRRADRDQLTALVNGHAAAVVPGVAASVNAVLTQFEREPDETIVGPWVAERRGLVAEQDAAIVAAALVVRYRDESDVGPALRGHGEIRWLLFRPEAPTGNPFRHDGWDAARQLMTACLEQMTAWRVRGVGADGALPVAGVYGVPAQWPHVERLYSEFGFAAPDDGVEIVHLAALDRIPAPGGARVDALRVRRGVGINGVRFTAAVEGEDVGYIEVEVLDGAERHPRVGGLADIGNLHVADGWQRRGIAGHLLAHAAGWLRLGHVDRLMHYASPSETALLAFVEKHGFVELTRTRRGWRRLSQPLPYGSVACSASGQPL